MNRELYDTLCSLPLDRKYFYLKALYENGFISRDVFEKYKALLFYESESHPQIVIK